MTASLLVIIPPLYRRSRNLLSAETPLVMLSERPLVSGIYSQTPPRTDFVLDGCSAVFRLRGEPENYASIGLGIVTATKHRHTPEITAHVRA